MTEQKPTVQNLKVKSVIVLVRSHTADVVSIELEGQSPFIYPPFIYPAVDDERNSETSIFLTTKATKGYGADWARKTFNVEPEVTTL